MEEARCRRHKHTHRLKHTKFRRFGAASENTLTSSSERCRRRRCRYCHWPHACACMHTSSAAACGGERTTVRASVYKCVRVCVGVCKTLTPFSPQSHRTTEHAGSLALATGNWQVHTTTTTSTVICMCVSVCLNERVATAYVCARTFLWKIRVQIGRTWT